MTLRYSSGLRNKLLDGKAQVKHIIIGTGISFGDGDGASGRDTINDSGNGLAGFSVGDMITVYGSTSNNVTSEILSVAAGKIEIAAGTLSTEAAGDTVALASARGGCLSDIFRYCVIDIYTDTQPASADDAERGTKLARLTQGGRAFTAGVETNGLLFGNPASYALAKEVGESWLGVGIAAGTAGWFRCYDNAVVTGSSSSAVRFDGAISTSGAQLNMTNTNISIGGDVTISTVSWSQPAA